MSILYAISIVYIAGEYDGPGFCTPIDILFLLDKQQNIFVVVGCMGTS